MKPTPPPKPSPKSPVRPTPTPPMRRSSTQPLNNTNYKLRQPNNSTITQPAIQKSADSIPLVPPKPPRMSTNPNPISPVNRYPQKQTQPVPALPQKPSRLNAQFKKIPTNPFDETPQIKKTSTNPFDDVEDSPQQSPTKIQTDFSPQMPLNETQNDFSVEQLEDDDFTPKEYFIDEKDDENMASDEDDFEIDVLNPTGSEDQQQITHTHSVVRIFDPNSPRQLNFAAITSPRVDPTVQTNFQTRVNERQTSLPINNAVELSKKMSVLTTPPKEMSKQLNSPSPRLISPNSKTPRNSQKIELKGSQFTLLDHNQYIQNLIIRFSEQCDENSLLIPSTVSILSTSMDDKAHYEYLIQNLKNRIPFSHEEINIQLLNLLIKIVRISDGRTIGIALKFSSERHSEKIRNQATVLMKEISKTCLKDVVDSFLQILNNVKNDESAREAAVTIRCFKDIVLPVDGINVSESVRIIGAIENALNTAQRSVFKRSLCEVLNGVTMNGLGRGNGVAMNQLEDYYGKIIDILRKSKSAKVSVNETCARLGGQTDGLYAISIKPILVSNYTLLITAKDQQKRLKYLEILSDYVSGTLDVLPKNHPLIQPLIDEYLAKTILPKKEYQRLKYASNSEVPLLSKVFSHPETYSHQTTMFILSGNFITATDIRAAVIQHLPFSITLPSEVQQGVTEFLSNTSSLIGLVMDPLNIWALKMYPESFIHDSTARETTSHKIVDAARSPILIIKEEARKALVRDAQRNPRLFCGIFEEFLGNGTEEESSWIEGEYVCELAEAFGKTNDVASKGLVNMLQRRVLALIITLDEKCVHIASRLVDALTLKGYRVIENSTVISKHLSLVSQEKVDVFVTQFKDLIFVKELYTRVSNSYSSKMQPELIRFVFAAMKNENQTIINSIISQYNEGVDHICSMVHALLPTSEPSIINSFAHSMNESKKKKINLELLNTLVSIDPNKYLLCQSVVSFCRTVLSNWVQFRDLPTSNLVLFEITSKICILETSLLAPSIEESLIGFISKYINQPSLHKYILPIVKAITLHAHISSPVNVFNIIEVLYPSDPNLSEEFVFNLLKRYPDMLASSMQRCFLSRDVREMYFKAVYRVITSQSILHIEQILSFAIVLAAKNGNDFSSLLKGLNGFGIPMYCGYPTGGSWNYRIMKELAKVYSSESPLILKGILQYHSSLSSVEYGVLLKVCKEWMCVAVKYDLKGTINIMIDMTSTAQQLDYEVCEIWSSIAIQCEDKIDVILQILLNKAENSDQSIGLIGKIITNLCGVETLSIRIFEHLYNNLMQLPTTPKQPGDLNEITSIFPTKKENIYYTLISFIISLLPLSTVEYIPHLCALSFLFYAPTTPHGELESCSRKVISVALPPMPYLKVFTGEGIHGMKEVLLKLGVLEEFEKIILCCSTVFQTEVAVNALDIFITLNDHPSFTLELLSIICARGLMFGEIQLVEKVIEAAIKLNETSIAEAVISVPMVAIFEKASLIVPIKSINTDILARAAGRKETQQRVIESTKNSTGLKQWIGELVKIGTSLQKSNFSICVIRALNDFEPKEVVETLMSIAEGGSDGVSTEALLQLCKFKYTFITNRLATLVARGMNCLETAQECATFLESYCIETLIPKYEFEQNSLFFEGVKEDEIKNESIKAIEKLCLRINIGIDRQKITMIVKNHSTDVKTIRTPFTL